MASEDYDDAGKQSTAAVLTVAQRSRSKSDTQKKRNIEVVL